MADEEHNRLNDSAIGVRLGECAENGLSFRDYGQGRAGVIAWSITSTSRARSCSASAGVRMTGALALYGSRRAVHGYCLGKARRAGLGQPAQTESAACPGGAQP